MCKICEKPSKFSKKWLRSHWCVRVVVDYVDTRFSRISSRKRNRSRNCFGLFILGTGRICCAKKWSKITWHCPCKLRTPSGSWPPYFIFFLIAKCIIYIAAALLGCPLDAVNVRKVGRILSPLHNLRFQFTFKSEQIGLQKLGCRPAPFGIISLGWPHFCTLPWIGGLNFNKKSFSLSAWKSNSAIKQGSPPLRNKYFYFILAPTPLVLILK